MLSRRSRFVRWTYVFSDLVCVAVAFVLSYWLHVALAGSIAYLTPIYPLPNYLTVLLESVVLILSSGYMFGMYNNVELQRPRDVASGTLKTVALGSALILAALFILKQHYVSRSLLLMFFALSFPVLAGGRWLLMAGMTLIRRRPQYHRSFVIVGNGPGAGELASIIENSERLGFHLLSFLHTKNREPQQPLGLKKNYSVFPTGLLANLLHDNVVDEVVFAVEEDELTELAPLMQKCDEEGVHIRVHLDFLPIGFSHVFVEELDQLPLLTFSNGPANDLSIFLKRAVDVVGSSIALILVSPLMFVLALLIKMTGKGPVLFRQERCGLGGQRFTLFKFRSMVVDAEERLSQVRELNEGDGPAFKLRNDPRCTWLGRWMRTLSLDELPQLWNVLRGDMSLVGPRPPLPDEVHRYAPWQRKRLRMRPGLTCLWVLEGRSQLQFDRWVRLDLLYIDNWSIWLDFKILLRTIPMVLSRKGAH